MFVGDGNSVLVDDTLVIIGGGNSVFRHAESVNQVDVYSFEEGRIVTQLGHEGFDRCRIGWVRFDVSLNGLQGFRIEMKDWADIDVVNIDVVKRFHPKAGPELSSIPLPPP